MNTPVINQLCAGSWCVDTVTLDFWLRVIAALSTFIIGVAASVLAYQQFRLSRAKLKFDLYERRLALFNRVRDFASAVALFDISSDLEKVDPAADPGKFYRETIEHRFLFPSDVWPYFAECYDRANRIRRCNLHLTSPNLADEDEQTTRNQKSEDMNWFFNQEKEMFTVFSRDLSIKTLR